jgi:hypothetical protein
VSPETAPTCAHSQEDRRPNFFLRGRFEPQQTATDRSTPGCFTRTRCIHYFACSGRRRRIVAIYRAVLHADGRRRVSRPERALRLSACVRDTGDHADHHRRNRSRYDIRSGTAAAPAHNHDVARTRSRPGGRCHRVYSLRGAAWCRHTGLGECCQVLEAFEFRRWVMSPVVV